MSGNYPRCNSKGSSGFIKDAPPSAKITWPVIHEASSEHSSETTLPISAGVPSRPIGVHSKFALNPLEDATHFRFLRDIGLDDKAVRTAVTYFTECFIGGRFILVIVNCYFNALLRQFQSYSPANAARTSVISACLPLSNMKTFAFAEEKI